ncbi:hypothetical protein [Halarcobacter ebronensis]|uniref:Uncharacterized protein n=1 Tax=Halarcobacter ebronensis TaxID=1462615 RepID=A0A4Q1AQL3_9BACT|nr:hypothetical protein [Halarcobacter ebronensis]QKF82395.1 putative membrane protein [Halarcobacter ebronensis]RXK07582.1 hypothetical protein CRV07_03725 [Halarcobacter ebronensis]
MAYFLIFWILMIVLVILIEQKIIASKFLIKRAHKYRHKTRAERIERRKEIEEYKKSLTHKYYLDNNLKDPELQKMIDKNKYKSLDAFRFEARLFYYGFFISILFGFIFTITGLYKDEFISSLYPYIQPYFKVFYHNFEKYTFNPLSFKVCFSWVFVFSVFILIILIAYFIKNPHRYYSIIKDEVDALGSKILLFLFVFVLNRLIVYLLNKQNFYLGEKIFYGFPTAYAIHFSLILIYFISILSFFIILIKILLDCLEYIKGKYYVNY